MNYKIIILFILIGSFLISTTIAASSDGRFNKDNKTLIIKNPLKNNDFLKIEQVSFKPDIVTMEEVFKITSYENYTFNNIKDFNIRWLKYTGKNDITKAKWEILEAVGNNITLPDFELIERNQEIPNVLSYTNVTDIYDLKPWMLTWGVNSKEKWEIITSEGKGTVGFTRYEITSTDPLNITFFWYENEQTGTHQEIRYRDEWKPFSPGGKKIKNNESITVKLTFSKKADTGRNSIKTIPMFGGVEEENFTWWNASWNYRIDNKISNGARPYQLTLNLSNSIGINNATHVFLNGHANINFTDVRFTLDNSTPLSYWIEKGTGEVWVNVTTNGTVNLYYGNPSATDSSDGKKTFDFFDDYEPESWQKLQKLPKPHADQAGAVLNGKIYTIGGYDITYNEPSALVWAYDPVTDSYLQRKNLTYARWGNACTGYGNNIYCFGGLPNHRTEKYDPINDIWTTLNEPPLSLQDQGLTTVTGGGYIYLFRGVSLYRYNPSTDTYLLLPNAPLQTLTNWPSMAYYNNEIYILGGYHVSGGVNYVNIYNLTTNVWRNGASMPIGLYGTLRENPVINNKIYILQGQGISSNQDFFSRFWVYDITTNSWNWGELGYWDADGVSGGVLGNKIYTFGGRRGHFEYDRGTDFAGVLDTTKNVPVKWIDVKSGGWREDFSSLTNGLFQYYPTVQIRTTDLVVNTNNKVISRMKYPGGSSGYGGLIIQSNDGVYGSTNNGYLDPFISIPADGDQLKRQTGGSSTLLGSRSLASPDVWHTYRSYYGSSSIRSTRDGGNNIVASDGTYRGGYIQVMKSIGFDLLIDYIAVARYTANEPIWATWSQEPASITPRITSWGNTKTNNNSFTLTINASEAITFNATANQTIIVWNWFKDDLDQNNNYNNFTASWPTGGIKTIKVTATSNNGTSDIITWNINVVAPSNIFFTFPTPANGAVLTQNFALINTSITGGSTAFIDWNRSLVGWWRFNGESGENSGFFRDWSSWGNNGACSGTNCPVSTSGMFGNALNFDGSNDYVTVPNSASLNPSNITLEAWFNVNPGGLAGQKPLIQKPYTSHAYPYYQYMLSLADTMGNPKAAEFYLTVNGVLQYIEIDNAGYTYGQWHYLAGTYDGSTMTMYLDGDLVGTTSVVGTITSYNTILEFGAYPNVAPGSSNVFNGKLDEVRLHGRAFSPEEIKASYDAGMYRLYRTFTGLAGGSYNYRAYRQNMVGAMDQTETRTLTIASVQGAPAITSFAPVSAIVNDNTGAKRSFNISIDQTATVNWYIDGALVQSNGSVTNAVFTNTSASEGTRIVNAAATNLNGTVAREWTWIVSSLPPTSTDIFFTYPTPANGVTLGQNYVFINTTVSNVSTAFIDWNRSLIGWWRFNNEGGENPLLFKDWSSWGNNGICSGVNCPSLTPGKFGNALNFDGINDYVTVPNSAILNPSNITLEAWFNVNSGGLAGQKPLIQKAYTSNTAPYYQYMLSLADTGGNPKAAEFYLTVNGVMRYIEINNAGYTYGQWHYLAGTYDGSTMTMYLDGNAVGTTSVVGTITSYNTILEFGAYPNVAPGSSNVFNGKLDEARIHSRALSPEEIKASYDAGMYRLYRTFTGLAGGSYNYGAYGQDLAGNVDQTEMRSLTLINGSGVPSIIGFDPITSTVNDNTNTIRTFSISLNQVSTINWYINGTLVQTNNSVISAIFKNSSSTPGTRIVNATASNANGTVSREWTWIGTPPQPPIITALSPGSSTVNDITNTTRTFSFSLNQNVIVNWYINGTPVQTNNSVTSAIFNTGSSTPGTRIVNATASNANGTVSREWTWIVSDLPPPLTDIFFTYPTPSDGAAIYQNYTIINTTVTYASTAFIDWNRSLIGWWRFNNEVGENPAFFRDWSSCGNNGTCSGTGCPASTSGKFGNALNFDGMNDYGTVPNSANLNPSKITLEAWFNVNSGGLAGQKPLIQKAYTSHVAPYYQYMLSLADTTGSPKSADFYLAVDGILQYVEINNLNYNYGQWHYLAGTYDGSTMTMYLDGNVVGTTSVVGTITSYNTILEFGAYPNVAPGSSTVFNGKLDEARIQSRALSPEEIKASYNAGINRLSRNFTNLPAGVYLYRGYDQNLSGNVNQTEMRSLTI